MPSKDDLRLFAPSESGAFGRALATELGLPLARHEEREFDFGEHKMRAVEPVRGRAVYLAQSLCGDAARSANDRLCRLLFFAGSLKDAGAGPITACMPYLAYARKDVRTKARDPIATRYVAQLIEAMGITRIMVLEGHNRAAIDNAFRIESVHLEATRIFAEHFAGQGLSAEVTVLSPDIGGAKRARHFKEQLERRLGRPVGFALMDKKRSQGVVSGELLAGDVRGRHVIVIDDLISSGGTLKRAAAACRRQGARRIDVVATHCPFSPEAHSLFDADGPDGVVATDSVALAPGFNAYLGGRLRILPSAPLFAEAIRRLETRGSVSALGGLEEPTDPGSGA